MALMKFREPNQVKWRGLRPGHNGEQVLENGWAENGTTVIYTVPAGKVFYFCGWSITSWAGAYAVGVYLEIYDGVPALWKQVHRGGQGASQVTHLSKSYWPPVEVPAGYSIRARSTAANEYIDCNIHGWIE